MTDEPSDTQPRSDQELNLEPWLREILVCPKCRAPLIEVRLDDGAPALRCTAADCGLTYPVVDGIPVLLVDDAIP